MKQRLHFIGLGGIGMSGLARMVLARGGTVSGSDTKDSSLLQLLRTAGARVCIGHAGDNLGGADTVVLSSAITPDNPELVAAQQRSLEILHRSALLEKLIGNDRLVAVTGTHGKSTTTAMVARVLIQAGLDPNVIVGAESYDFDGNWRVGTGGWFVAEADESDGSFLRCAPAVAVVTNLECEHMDHFGSEAQLLAEFQQFIGNVMTGGAVVLCSDSPKLRRLARRDDVRTYTYGLGDEAEWRVTGYEADARGSLFTVERAGLTVAWIKLQVPGPHNALNATAAMLAAHAAGVELQPASEALKQFRGIRRRMEVVGTVGGATVVDDYAHHPSEVAATLRAARERWPHLVAVFQPHRYTRTRDLADEFGHAFGAADEVIITEVYPANEPPLPGVSGELIAQAIARHEPGASLAYLPTKAAVLRRVREIARPGGAVLMMGAGDVTAWARELVGREW